MVGEEEDRVQNVLTGECCGGKKVNAVYCIGISSRVLVSYTMSKAIKEYQNCAGRENWVTF